ncbi:MAG: hypothetical protein V4719_02470 [Planctomycetota bacterium]
MTERARPWMEKVRVAMDVINDAVGECAKGCPIEDLPAEVALIAAAVQTQAEVLDRTSEGEDCEELESELKAILTHTASVS